MTASWIRTLAQTAQATESGLVGWRVERLRNSLAGPLAIVGGGATRTVAVLWARLHEQSGHPAWAMTPYELVDRGVPPGARVLFLSVSGRHHDSLRAARVAGELGVGTHAVVLTPRSPLAAMVREAAPDNGVMVLAAPAKQDSLTAIHSLVSMSVLAATVYGSGSPWSPLFYVQSEPIPPGRPRDIVVLGVGMARPAALDFALRCRASGFAPAHVTDLRDFAHGDLMSVHHSDTWIVSFAAGSQCGPMARALDAIPQEIPRICFNTEQDGVAAALELMARSMVSFVQLAERLEFGAGDGDRPRWTSQLFYMPLDRD